MPTITKTVIVPEVFERHRKGTYGYEVVTTPVTGPTYTILPQDDVVFFNTDAQAGAATLPAGTQGDTVKVVNTGTSGNDLDVTPDGTENLIGVNSAFTLKDGESLIITYSDTEGWY